MLAGMFLRLFQSSVPTPGARDALVTHPTQLIVPERVTFPPTSNFSVGAAVPIPTLPSEVFSLFHCLRFRQDWFEI